MPDSTDLPGIPQLDLENRPASDTPSDSLQATALLQRAPSQAVPTKSDASADRLDSIETWIREDQQLTELAPMAPVNRCHVWGADFDCVTMDEAVQWIDLVIQHRATTYAITANLNYLMLCDQHPRLKAFTNRCPLVLCDGKPIQWRSMLDKYRLPERVAGSDLIYRLGKLSAERNYGIYLLGGAPGVASRAAEELVKLNPGLHISGVHCPPFGKWSAKDREEMRQRIVQANPDILLVAFGQPKGEFWIEENYCDLNVPISIQVGASFDFVAGNSKRAPKGFQTIGAEWLYRMLHDPRRLGPRYFANAMFLLKAIRRELLQRLV